jgi:hypothetical protein
MAPFGPPDVQTPALGTLRLNQPLEVPAGHARVFLQKGAVVPKTSLDEYEVNCSLELRSVREFAQPIAAGRFQVLSVQQMRGQVVRAGSVQFALGGDEGDAMIHLGWHLWLHSKEQPEVLRMTCRGELGHPSEVTRPSPPQIHRALSSIADLRVYSWSTDLSPDP